ncbi:MAG: hypothetical protein PHE24_01380 [Patescibacteria group bacterium]|nr:hypothetical protein [Patescibacteria group bacterium]
MINEKSFEPSFNAAENTEQQKFDWRKFLDKPEMIPARLAEQLDTITQFVNDDTEGAGEIWETIKAGQTHGHVLQYLTGCFRDVINQEDREELSKLFKEAGEKRMPMGDMRLKLD